MSGSPSLAPVEEATLRMKTRSAPANTCQAAIQVAVWTSRNRAFPALWFSRFAKDLARQAARYDKRGQS